MGFYSVVGAAECYSNSVIRGSEDLGSGRVK